MASRAMKWPTVWHDKVPIYIKSIKMANNRQYSNNLLFIHKTAIPFKYSKFSKYSPNCTCGCVFYSSDKGKNRSAGEIV